MDSFLNPTHNPVFSIAPADWRKPEGFAEENGTPYRWLNAKVSDVYLGLDPDPIIRDHSSLVFAIKFETEEMREAVIELALSTFQPEQMLYAGISDMPEAFQRANTSYDLRPVDLIRQLLELTDCKQVEELKGSILKIQVHGDVMERTPPVVMAVADPLRYKDERIVISRLDTIDRLIEDSRRAAESFGLAVHQAEQYRINERREDMQEHPGFCEDPEELKKAESEFRLVEAVYDRNDPAKILFGIIADNEMQPEAEGDPDHEDLPFDPNKHENEPPQE